MKTSSGAAIFLTNPVYNTEILIAKRSHIKKKFPNYWELPGGAIEDFETPEKCISREIQEELGSEIENLKLEFTDLSYHSGQRYIVFLFSGQINPDSINTNPEISEWKYDNINSICEYKLYPRVKEQLRIFSSQLPV